MNQMVAARLITARLTASRRDSLVDLCTVREEGGHHLRARRRRVERRRLERAKNETSPGRRRTRVEIVGK